MRTATLLWDGRDNADLRAATDAIGQAAVDIGLDRFKDFLRRTDDHLATPSGSVILVRSVLDPAPQVVEAPLVGPSTFGRILGPVVGVATLALPALAKLMERQEFRDTVNRFHLDVSKPADVTAAYAYLWAERMGPWIFDTPQTGPRMLEMAERVMRVARANPDLFARALADGSAAQRAFTAAVQAPIPGIGQQVEFADNHGSFITNPLSVLVGAYTT